MTLAANRLVIVSSGGVSKPNRYKYCYAQHITMANVVHSYSLAASTALLRGRYWLRQLYAAVKLELCSEI
jgi:hypothetical protein